MILKRSRSKKLFYYQESVRQLKSFKNGIEYLKKMRNKNILVFKVNEDLKFQLTLLNNIKYLSVVNRHG
jgi:hypothetical protein